MEKSKMNGTYTEKRFSPGKQTAQDNGIFAMLPKLAVCGASGILFGIAAEKAQVHVPSVIINQMDFSQFTMLKMFLSMLASSVMAFSVISILPNASTYFHMMKTSTSCGLRTQTLTKTCIGAAVLGAGMTLSGSCPGMVLVQIGSGTQNAVITLTGCFAGALLYSIVDSVLQKVSSVSQTSSVNDHFLHARFNVPYVFLGLPFAMFLAGVVLTVEHYVPWTQEVSVGTGASSLLAQKSWNPALAGILAGVLQVPVVLAVGDTLGGSSAYCTLVSMPLHTAGQLSNRIFQYFKRFISGIGNWWQVIYVGGAVAGGYLSASMSGSLNSAEGVAPLFAFIGGMCLLFGARTAAGCTSGHGISGMGMLAVHSLLATPCIFAGGIGTAFLINHLSIRNF